MSQLITHRFFTSVTTTAASASFLTDYRFNDIPQRTIQGVLAGEAHVELYTYLDRSDEAVEYLASTFTATANPTFQYFINGPVAKIKCVMVSGGTATIEGLV